MLGRIFRTSPRSPSPYSLTYTSHFSNYSHWRPGLAFSTTLTTICRTHLASLCKCNRLPRSNTSSQLLTPHSSLAQPPTVQLHAVKSTLERFPSTGCASCMPGLEAVLTATAPLARTLDSRKEFWRHVFSDGGTHKPLSPSWHDADTSSLPTTASCRRTGETVNPVLLTVRRLLRLPQLVKCMHTMLLRWLSLMRCDWTRV
ncbi:hypothetical protein FKP32DRAFT_536639 [Trametes sanguinea]|nr:hypothetical protein FKP32DRAFT_536639 [Trametes sanguinea]